MQLLEGGVDQLPEGPCNTDDEDSSFLCLLNIY